MRPIEGCLLQMREWVKRHVLYASKKGSTGNNLGSEEIWQISIWTTHHTWKCWFALWATTTSRRQCEFFSTLQLSSQPFHMRLLYQETCLEVGETGLLKSRKYSGKSEMQQWNWNFAAACAFSYGLWVPYVFLVNFNEGQTVEQWFV